MQDGQRETVKTISVVIPTLNETAELVSTVQRLRAVPEVAEIIVADGGSIDDTTALAERLGCKVVSASRGRGRQMRAGAAQATGDVVLLLHADTWVKPEIGAAILDALNSNNSVGGGCWKQFREPHWMMRGSRFRCFIRFYLFRRFMGDQAMFVKRDVLAKLGGIPDVPIMEDFELCRRLRSVGRLVMASTTVSTSSRRFRKFGVLRLYVRMWRVTFQYFCGTPPERLRRIYEGE